MSAFDKRYNTLYTTFAVQMDELFERHAQTLDDVDSPAQRERETTAWNNVIAFQIQHGMEGWNTCMCSTCKEEWVDAQIKLGRTE